MRQRKSLKKGDITPRASCVDVARRAGVSTATVSRVLNCTGRVSPEKQSAVERACEELGYMVNGAARALSSKRTMAIGAVVPTIETETFVRPLAAFQRTIQKSGYTLLLASSGFSAEIELREVTTLLEHGIDALMVVGTRHDPRLWKQVERKGLPCVQAWSLESGHPSVGFDNAAVGAQMAQHLIDLGHRRIAMIVGTPPSNDRGFDRVEGTRTALRASGLELAEPYLVTSAFDLSSGRLAMKRLLALPVPPTAVICGNDFVAHGAMLSCAELGIDVPRDVSIAGFNDFEYAKYLTPALTTIRVDLEEMGKAAAKYLLNMLGKGVAGPKITRIETQLIVRSSTGPPARDEKDVR